MQDVQTFMRLRVPDTTARTVWMFGTRKRMNVCTSCIKAGKVSLDAGRADVHALAGSGHDSANGLDVRVPAAAGSGVRVRHVIAEARPLAAYVADGSHGSLH